MAIPVLDEFGLDSRISGIGAEATAASATAAPAAEATVASRFAGYGAKLRQFMGGVGGTLLRPLPAVGTLAQGVTGPDSTPVANAIRIGVGAGGLLNPAVGIPLNTGMQIANTALSAASEPILNAATTDWKGPATNAFLAKGGNTTTYPSPPMAAPVEQPQTGSIPDESGYGAVPPVKPATPEPYKAQTDFGGVIQALAGIKQITGDESAKRAALKLENERMGKVAQAGKDTAEATLSAIRAGAARQAALNGADPGEIAAITAGRSQGAVYTGFPDITGKNVDVLQTRGPGAGAVSKRASQPPVTRAEVTAMAKSKGLTEAQVIENMRQNGRVLAN